MATRLKTITVPTNFGNPSDLADNTITVLGTPTIYIPENNGTTPVTFVSVVAFVSYADVSTVTGATIANTTVRATLNGAAAASFTHTPDLVHTGENKAGVIGPVDFTAHFTANFGTGTSKTCELAVLIDHNTGTGLQSRGVYGWYEITYEYDDTRPTHIKTICYPLSEVAGALGTSANVSIGTIPQLNTLLCENSPTIRHAWIVVRGNANNNTSTIQHNLSYSFDASGSNALPTIVTALASDTYHTFLIDASALATNATHTFDLWNSTATRWHNIIAELWVTYEFTVSGTTRALNYVELGMEFDSPMMGTTSAQNHRYQRTVLIPEPGTITTRRKTIEFRYSTDEASTVQLKVGAQASYTAFASAHSHLCGMSTAQLRFDSGSAGGDGQTLTNGENVLIIDAYRSAGALTNVNGKIRLLYESDVHANGIGAHSHTVRRLMREISFTTVVETTITDAVFAIPESLYYLRSVQMDAFMWLATLSGGSIVFMVRVETGEAEESGWRPIWQDATRGDGEISWQLSTYPMGQLFNRYPGDPRALLDIENARDVVYGGQLTIRFGAMWTVTYHACTYTWTGDVTGSNGGTVTINLCRADNGERVATTSRSGNGAYSFTTYDNTVTYFAEAREGADYLGRSDNATAT